MQYLCVTAHRCLFVGEGLGQSRMCFLELAVAGQNDSYDRLSFKQQEIKHYDSRN